MPGLNELAAFAVEDTLRAADLVNPGSLSPATAARIGDDLNELRNTLSSGAADPYKIVELLIRIGHVSNEELATTAQGTDLDRHRLANLTRRASDHTASLILHPDYKPPRRNP